MKKEIRKLAALSMAVCMAASLAGCGGGNTSSGNSAGGQTTQAAAGETRAAEGGEAAGSGDAGDWKWERKVTLVCPWGVGGGADGTLRPLQPELEKVLGVPVEIVNVEGAGGANGIDFTCKQPGDG